MKLLDQKRIRQFIKSSVLVLAILFSISAISFNTKANSGLKYYILKGENKQNENMLVLLHGMNSNTEIWNEFISSVDEKTLLVVIQAPFKTTTGIYRWYDIDVTQKPFISDLAQMIESTHKVAGLVNELKAKYEITDDKVVMAGFSQGAIMSINYALTNPNSIAGFGVFSGMLPDTIDSRISNEIEDLPIFITHGSQDKGIELELARKAESFLRGKNASVTMTIENAGHEITPKQFQDFISWIEGLKTNE